MTVVALAPTCLLSILFIVEILCMHSFRVGLPERVLMTGQGGLSQGGARHLALELLGALSEFSTKVGMSNGQIPWGVP